jgi:hypothetical protein
MTDWLASADVSLEDVALSELFLPLSGWGYHSLAATLAANLPGKPPK